MVKKKWVCNDCRERTCTVLTESKHDYDPFVDNLKPYIVSGCLYGGTGYFQLSPPNIQKEEPKIQTAPLKQQTKPIICTSHFSCVWRHKYKKEWYCNYEGGCMCKQ